MRTSIVNVYKSKVSPTKILIQQNLQMNNKLATSELRYASQNAGRLTRKNYLAEMLDMFIYMSTMPISVWKTLANFLSQRLDQKRLGEGGGGGGGCPYFHLWFRHLANLSILTLASSKIVRSGSLYGLRHSNLFSSFSDGSENIKLQVNKVNKIIVIMSLSMTVTCSCGGWVNKRPPICPFFAFFAEYCVPLLVTF